MKLRSIGHVLLLLILIPRHFLFGQSEILDNNPPGIIWNQIITPHFKIVFDSITEDNAQQLANKLEALYQPVSKSLEEDPKQISVILQNQNSISNGFVSQTPRRSEFYGTPPQDYNFLGVLNWLDLLAVHEFRHVVQFDKSLTKFNKFLHVLFGYEVSSSMAHIAVPDWFWEGDAVNLETALTPGGRGRIPNFGLLFRANTLERGAFSYHRQYLRSFKYNIQNHYVFGHYFTAYLRGRYGENLISKVTEETWSWPFIPFRFSGRLKKHTGKSLISNYNEMMIELDSIWNGQLEDREFTGYSLVNVRKKKAYTDYLYPHYLKDGRILALKRGIGDISTFVAFDSIGNHQKLYIPGIMNDGGMISVGKDKIAWNEFEFDPRFRKKTYSVIKTYDLKTGKIQRLTKKSRYGSAGLSPDDSRIVTVETTPDLRHSLTIIHAGLGRKSYKIPNPENYFYVHPRWSEDGEHILAVKQGDEGKTIMIYNVETRETFDLWPMSYENIGYPFMHQSFVLYNSPYDGIDNIYAYDLVSKKKFRVTNSRYGAYNPHVSWDGKAVIYNEFSKDGHNIAEIDFNPNEWTPIEEVIINKESIIDPVIEQEGNPNILQEVDSVIYPVKRFRIGRKIINPYSWGPYITSTDLDFQIGIKSQDIMSTTTLDLGYRFNANERTGRWQANFTYQGIYPALGIGGYLGSRSVDRRFVRRAENGTITSDTTVNITWEEKGIVSGFRFPLLLTRSRYNQNLDLGYQYTYTAVNDYSYDARYPDMLSNGGLQSNRYYLSYRRIMKRSKRDLAGKFGQTIYTSYEHTPFKSDFLGGLLAAEIRLFFPGIFKHHSFHLRSGYLNQQVRNNDKTYLFQSPIMFTRGYNYQFYENYWNNSVNYSMPLIYPDLHLGSFLNIQRIYATFFYDTGTRFLNGDQEYLRSVGTEVSFDFNLMRFLTLLNAGFRYSYAMDDPNQMHKFQILVGSFGF